MPSASIFDSLIADIANKFNLGSTGGTLVEEVLRLITGRPGGVSGFLDMFKTAGLGNLASSWLGRADNPPLSTHQVEQVLGSSFINNLAGKLGIGGSVAGSALAYVVPKLIGLLTPGGNIPSGIPSSVSGFLNERAAPPAMARTVVEERQEGFPKWLIPALLGLALLGLLWYLFRGRPEERPAVVQATPTATVTPAPTVEATPTVTPTPTVEATPTPVVQATAAPSGLSLVNENGVVTLSGAVKDDATKTSILDALKTAFGADNVKGDITVDAAAAPTGADWLTKLKAAVDALKTPGLKVNFAGKDINVGGLTDANRDKVIDALKSAFGTDFSVKQNP